MRVTFFGSDLQCVVYGIVAAIQITEGTQRPEDIGAQRIGVELDRAAGLDRGWPRIRVVEIADALVQVSAFVPDISDADYQVVSKSALDFSSPLPDVVIEKLRSAIRLNVAKHQQSGRGLAGGCGERFVDGRLWIHTVVLQHVRTGKRGLQIENLEIIYLIHVIVLTTSHAQNHLVQKPVGDADTGHQLLPIDVVQIWIAAWIRDQLGNKHTINCLGLAGLEGNRSNAPLVVPIEDVAEQVPTDAQVDGELRVHFEVVECVESDSVLDRAEVGLAFGGLRRIWETQHEGRKPIRYTHDVVGESQRSTRYVGPGAYRVIEAIQAAKLEIVPAAIHHQVVAKLMHGDEVQLSWLARVRQAAEARYRDDGQPLFVGGEHSIVVAGDAKIETQRLLLEAGTGQASGEIAVRAVQTVAQIVQHTGRDDLGPAKREVLRAIGSQRL